MQNPSKITKNNSQGIIFAIISCQRVIISAVFIENARNDLSQDFSPAVAIQSGVVYGKVVRSVGKLQNGGVRRSARNGVPGAFRPRVRECPQSVPSVPGVSKRCPEHLFTLGPGPGFFGRPRFQPSELRGFEKGLAGGGWRPTNPPKQPTNVLWKCVPLLLRGA